MDLYALVDCNNFYVSCERVFDPGLRNVPVIVLSNNDGCAIARSEEAKEIGISMGAPLFEIMDAVKKYNVRVFSSNYVLYGDMSARVMDVLKCFTPNIEVYSIDEAFLLFKGFSCFNMQDYAAQIRDTVYKWTGLPVSVGIGKTKTLAKIASHLAKRTYKTGAFCLLEDADPFLKNFAVEKIWGIGRRRQRWLNACGIYTAYDLKNMPDRLVKNKMTVTGLRTAWELRGISCLELEETLPDKKALGCSRMFGYEVKSLSEMEEAVSSYIARACVKLRRQNLLAGYLQVHVETSRFKEDYYCNSIGMHVNPPSAYTPLLSRYGGLLLREIFKGGYNYKRAGVILTSLSSERQAQQYLIGPVYTDTPSQKLMRVIDKYNLSVNNGKIQFASEGLGKPWQMKQLRRSRRFTTNWKELLEVNI